MDIETTNDREKSKQRGRPKLTLTREPFATRLQPKYTIYLQMMKDKGYGKNEIIERALDLFIEQNSN